MPASLWEQLSSVHLVHKEEAASAMVLGGGSTGDKGLDHLRLWEEGRKCLLGTCAASKLKAVPDC